MDEARARVKAAGEALKTAKEKVNATEEAKETRNAREKLREMKKMMINENSFTPGLPLALLGAFC